MVARRTTTVYPSVMAATGSARPFEGAATRARAVSFRRHLLQVAVTTLAPAVPLGVIAAPTPAKAAGHCVLRAAASPPSVAARPARSSGHAELYSIGDEVYTVDHGATAYYNFQGNRDGSAKAKYEVRYNRNLWDTCAQLQVRAPFVTRYPATPNAASPTARPYTGFGNAEVRYSYNVTAPTFDHSLQAGFVLPTESNGVESYDTRFKAFYNVLWKWDGGSIAYTSKFDQTIIRPPGASYTSYYEGKLTLPSYAFANALRGLNFSGIYDYRAFFDATTPDFKSAAGGVINGSFNDVAFSLSGTSGLGLNGLWRYKIEASAVARF